MIPMHHPDLADSAIEAVSEDQAAHLETLGWVRSDAVVDDTPEPIAETITGTSFSLGDEVQLSTPDGTPLSLVPEGTVDEVLAWVDQSDHGWADRARLALAAEEASEHPRKTITEPLTAALNPED